MIKHQQANLASIKTKLHRIKNNNIAIPKRKLRRKEGKEGRPAGRQAGPGREGVFDAVVLAGLEATPLPRRFLATHEFDPLADAVLCASSTRG